MKRISLLIGIGFLVIMTSACTNGNQNSEATEPSPGTAATEESTIPWIATKNTTRVNTSDPFSAAVLVSQTIWPDPSEGNRPGGVLIMKADWQFGLAAADLIHHPFNGPILFTEDDQLPEATANEIKRLNPAGVGSEKVQVLLIGDVSKTVREQVEKLGYKIGSISGTQPAALAREIDSYYAKATGSFPSGVLVGSLEYPEYSLPAVNWIAHMPEPLLYVSKDSLPAETIDALKERKGKANIYILGPEKVISPDMANQLAAYGKVTRISGKDPFDFSVAFAKFFDPGTQFGWNINTPGHNLSFVPLQSPLLAVAAAPFSHLGKHAPLIWIDKTQVPSSVMNYTMELRPTFTVTPSAGPFNHGMMTGAEDTIPFSVQTDIDTMLEISPADGNDGHAMH